VESDIVTGIRFAWRRPTLRYFLGSMKGANSH
jgi:hypothetical protein